MSAAAVAFHALVDEEWELRVAEDPLFATAAGDNRYNDRLPHVAEADFNRRAAALRAFRARLSQIDPAVLSPADQLNYAIFQRLLDNELGEYAFQAYLLPLSKAYGFHSAFPELALFMPMATEADYAAYIARLTAFRQYVHEHIDLLRAGLRQGFVPPRVTLDTVPAAVALHIVAAPEQSALYQPFTQFPATVPAAARPALTSAGAQARKRRRQRMDSRMRRRLPCCR